MKILLDTNVITRLCHPNQDANRQVTQWLEALIRKSDHGLTLCLPEIADYEARRGLLHVALRSGQSTTKSLVRLDLLTQILEYLPLNTQTLRRAAGLWAETRHVGRPTAPATALDGDVILAAQALEVDGLVVTDNTRHLSRLVAARSWREIQPGGEQLS